MRGSRTVVTLAVLVGTARADAPRVPDESLRAVGSRVVRLELDGAAAVEGRLLAFEAGTVTLAVTTSQEVVTVRRDQLARMMLAEPPAPAVVPASTELVPPPTVEPRRIVSAQFSLLGTVAADAEYKRLYGFASTNLLLPILTASGSSTYIAAAAGAGLTLPLSEGSRWKLDVFAAVLPLHTTSFYTYLGFGAGAGFHYTASSGFTFGFKIPIVGFATRLGSSPHGYDASFRYNDSVGYYYLAGLAGMPLLTMGYRFASRR